MDTTTQEPKLWDQIKKVNLELFSLPPQPAEKFFDVVLELPNKLLLNCKIAAALPALEAALGKAYLVDREERYVSVQKVVG